MESQTIQEPELWTFRRWESQGGVLGEAAMVSWVWPWRRGGGPPRINQLCSQVCSRGMCSRKVSGLSPDEQAASCLSRSGSFICIRGWDEWGGGTNLFILIVVMIILTPQRHLTSIIALSHTLMITHLCPALSADSELRICPCITPVPHILCGRSGT